MRTPASRPPAILPPPRGRSTPAGPERASLTLALHTITRVMGGGTVTRHVDRVDFVRVPSIRGHLRFWWRALYGSRFTTAAELFAAESALWGGVHGQQVTRSAVEITCRAQTPDESLLDRSNVAPQDPHGYALWPAREEKKQGVVTTPAGERWRRLDWTLTLSVPSGQHEEDVRRALQAWLLFGGYGGRTRRGCGALDVTLAGEEARRAWLPADASVSGIERLLGAGALVAPSRPAGDLPLLAGSRLYVGDVPTSADAAWGEALKWLRAFRQEPAPTPPDTDYAREPQHGDPRRPGPSRFPESDKLRQLAKPGGGWAHAPRHNAEPAWPRAGFGLPIVTHFKDAQDGPDTELVWQRPGDRKPHDRLASPLILKPLALADGRFVPIALWLYRAYPHDGQVVARQGLRVLAGSAAAFDVLTAPGDPILYQPLLPSGAPAGERLKTAFFDWLTRHARVRRLV